MEKASPLRVLIVEDHEVVRLGLRALLDREPDIEVAGLASSGKEALALLESARPDVVLLDFHLPGADGASLCAQLARRAPRVPVLVLTATADDDILLTALEAGARGYVVKSEDVSQVAEAVRKVARGEAVLAPEGIERVLIWARTGQIKSPRSPSFTGLEIGILRSLSAGQSAREIAHALRISEETVSARVRAIKRRLGASDRAHAVVLAMKRGII